MTVAQGEDRRAALRFESRSGLTQVELMTAVMVLAVGLLSLAAASGWLIRSGSAVDDRFGRIAALTTTIEELVARPFDELSEGCRSDGDVTVSWRITDQQQNSAVVEVIAVGPRGSRSVSESASSRSRASSDTLYYLAARR